MRLRMRTPELRSAPAPRWLRVTVPAPLRPTRAPALTHCSPPAPPPGCRHARSPARRPGSSRCAPLNASRRCRSRRSATRRCARLDSSSKVSGSTASRARPRRRGDPGWASRSEPRTSARASASLSPPISNPARSTTCSRRSWRAVRASTRERCWPCAAARPPCTTNTTGGRGIASSGTGSRRRTTRSRPTPGDSSATSSRSRTRGGRRPPPPPGGTPPPGAARPGADATAWVASREVVIRRGRLAPSFEEVFPGQAGLVDLRQERLVYGAEVSRDRRAGEPHWGRGYLATVRAERFDRALSGLTIRSGHTTAPQFTRLSFKGSAGFSFMRDPRPIRIAGPAVSTGAVAGSAPLLIPDLVSLGADDGLASLDLGRFRDRDLLYGALTYIFPLATE